MRPTTALLSLAIATTIRALPAPAPPSAAAALDIKNISYWGSACPTSGLSATLGAVDNTTGLAPLSFELANFLPALGSFGSSLRMCSIVSFVSVSSGWTVSVNSKGTNARGRADVPGNATMYLRSSYAFASSAEVQSVNMLDVPGPLTGPFAKLLAPSAGDKGIVAPCGGGELDIEFQARAVENDGVKEMAEGVWTGRAVNETSWVLSTDVQVVRC
ncbi:hypothetical protein K491DRAFT_755117 [Lophiostoma macrostomum CBS 122681]|uniref:Uncharacterized protein n=1 Tax=Lophiostoma macrostomum CBS 122681 TaxID=1314788 RepID=A0A6A6TJ99_9PLEO|nr:hypothetical protein K491DRAFT_755117 [Lophiostoma macrostomum CBS 122681]